MDRSESKSFASKQISNAWQRSREVTWGHIASSTPHFCDTFPSEKRRRKRPSASHVESSGRHVEHASGIAAPDSITRDLEKACRSCKKKSKSKKGKRIV
eukprot:2657280-Rhodomonas_salina.2